MANLPAQHPSLALHLVDRSLTPLITSAQNQQQAQTLVGLSQTALGAHETAQRLGLGLPQRIMVEHASNGPILLQSFLNPGSAQPAPEGQSSVNGQRTRGTTAQDSTGHDQFSTLLAESEATEAEDVNAPPLLISTVIAPTSDAVLESRRAAARLERVGREVQTKWAELQNPDGLDGK
ncbi:hypothetical protein PFICI_06893 [Pestalotiopsis fici W106-1]|uniref:Uncharacterized protein n=1 Tax=Pestalotiopsis fici (strain W106-1 / CGMCC3.15140) TaxID=1229662 RepID=W3X9P3_PESFW|nr:uncharacterized protein PFICI_06893 [Pestalotiopsis fici W106-1]ETS81891.1 hypothetical protein PFICI_06893 [Pestalotiopsis fici W106-1]